MSDIIFILMPFLTIILFLLGMGYRIYSWVTTKQPGLLTLFPAPKRGAATFWNVLKESLLFPSLFKGNRILWIFAWIFHATLAMIIIGHIRVFTDFPALWAALGIDADSMSAISGGTAGVIIMVMGFLLFFRRLGTARVREISNLSDYLALLLILAIIITGNWMRFGEHFDLAQTRIFFGQLFTFSFATINVPQNSMFLLHFFLVQVLIMFIPFSKIMHFGGIFFTQTLIQRT